MPPPPSPGRDLRGTWCAWKMPEPSPAAFPSRDSGHRASGDQNRPARGQTGEGPRPLQTPLPRSARAAEQGNAELGPRQRRAGILGRKSGGPANYCSDCLLL